jgi:hypothetical protein
VQSVDWQLNVEQLRQLCVSHASLVSQHVAELHRRMQERQTTTVALKEGLSLPASMVLTYL